MTYDEFVAKWTGVAADYDKSYGAQCVDLFNFYNRDVVGQGFVGTPSTGGAADLWNDHPSLPGYSKVARSGIPPKGAVVVWAANTSATGPAGHVGIASGEGNATYFVSFDQNYPTGSKPHMERHSYAGVLGWYVPNNQGGNMPSSQDKTDDLSVRLGYNLALIRQPSEDEIRARSGKQTQEELDRELLGSPEHQQVAADRAYGLRAKSENWEKQIADLKAQLAAKGKTLDPGTYIVP